MSVNEKRVVSLVFTNGGHYATVVSNGLKTAVFKAKKRTYVHSMGNAIAALERHGYRLISEQSFVV